MRFSIVTGISDTSLSNGEKVQVKSLPGTPASTT